MTLSQAGHFDFLRAKLAIAAIQGKPQNIQNDPQLASVWVILVPGSRIHRDSQKPPAPLRAEIVDSILVHSPIQKELPCLPFPRFL